MLSVSDIHELWQTGGTFREIAAEEVVRDMRRHTDTFFELLPHDDTGALVRHARGEFPFLWHGFGPAVDYDVDAPCCTFDEFRQQEALFRRGLRRHLDTLDAPRRQAYAELVDRYFPELRQYLPAGDECRRQLMIFVTGICNLQCPFCFSNDIERREVTLGQLRRICLWAHRQGVTQITPCGGEPLLYSHMPQLLEMAALYGMSVYFASNLTIPLDRFPRMFDGRVEQIYAHLTVQTMRTPRLMQTFARNIELCHRHGVEVVGRVNITADTGADIDDALRALVRMHIRRVNFALTIPSTNASNQFVATSDFQPYMDTLTRLMRAARDMGLQTGIAKPLPVCLFDRSVVMDMMSAAIGATRCEIDADDYMHNLSLSPSMDFSPCLGLENIVVPFSDDITWQQLRERFAPLITEYMRRPLYDHCTDCYLWRRRLCQGSCLTYKQ